VDLDGRVVTMNTAAELLTGLFAAEATGRYCTEIFSHSPEVVEVLMESLARSRPGRQYVPDAREAERERHSQSN